MVEGRAVQTLLPVLLPMLDGTRTVEEIAGQIEDSARPHVPAALGMLQERELLTDGPPASADTPELAETAQLLAAVSADGRTIAESEEILARSSASVIGAGAAAREIARLLATCGVTRLSVGGWPQSSASLEPADLTVVAPEPAELPRLEDWNRLALEAGLPWMQVLPFDGGIGVVGPIYVPGHTCCYECYRRRRGANLDYGDANYWAVERNPAPFPSTPSLQALAAGLAVTLILQWLCDPPSNERTSPLPSVMHALEWGPPPRVSSHRVFRVPRCPQCFGDDLGTPSPWGDRSAGA